MEQMTWTILGSMFAMLSLFTTIIVWKMSRIESNMDAMGMRIDATNARIDITQGIIMRMLEKQGK